jgi:hypothetical protein
LYITGVQGRTLLEKKIFFMNPETKKIDSCSYWKIYLGTYSLSIKDNEFDTAAIPYLANVNLTLFSSGYIDGAGYGQNGKITCLGKFATDSSGTVTNLNFDSIDYINKSGSSVRYHKLPPANVFVAIGENRLVLKKKMTLTKYISSGEDEISSLTSTGEVPVTFFAFSKAAYSEAVKAETDTLTKH